VYKSGNRFDADCSGAASFGPIFRLFMEYVTQIIDFFIHLDRYLGEIIRQYGAWTYALLTIVVFCETGLVVTPFLPGDSLLFAAGAFSAKGDLNVYLVALLLFIAAVLGDAVNYAVGKYIGPRAFEIKDSRIFKREYLERTQRFYDKYGGKTIVIARFVPIVRTFAPFLAGVGTMSYPRFALYNVSGAFLWVLLFVFGGYLFGSHPFVEENFSLVILVIIIISVMPAVIEAIRVRR